MPYFSCNLSQSYRESVKLRAGGEEKGNVKIKFCMFKTRYCLQELYTNFPRCVSR